MPFVTVHMWEGRSVDDKRALTAAITRAMVEHAHARPDALHVVIQEYPLENWALNGVLGVDRTDT
jgi:4-oxalocrotonate tautomerase